MAQALGLRRLQDFIQGSGTELAPDAPVWLLGVEHKPKAPRSDADGNGDGGADGDGSEQQHEDAILDFRSRIWVTYRKGFPEIGMSGLTSDAGWGCTLRSGQMLLAEGLLRHMMGRSWRLGGGAGQPSEMAQLLRWLHDGPVADSPFSVHNLCCAPGVHGVQAGEWLGPWVLCRALEVAVNAARPLGIAAHVLAEPGGGAPTVYPSSLEKSFFPTAGEGQEPASALLVLLPLTLGIDKVNPRYVPQLRTVLKWPHSIGIVGGRPGSSLYFVGFQGDNVLFLDPHETQQVVADSEVGDAATYHCDTLRLMPLASIDPSLAIGFYCRSAESLRELCSQLAQLEVKSAGAPLVSIAKGDAPAAADWQHESSSSSSGAGKGDDWELL